MVRAIVRCLIFADRTVGSHLDLVYAYDRDMGHKSALQSRFARTVSQHSSSRRRTRQRAAEPAARFRNFRLVHERSIAFLSYNGKYSSPTICKEEPGM